MWCATGRDVLVRFDLPQPHPEGGTAHSRRNRFGARPASCSPDSMVAHSRRSAASSAGPRLCTAVPSRDGKVVRRTSCRSTTSTMAARSAAMSVGLRGAGRRARCMPAMTCQAGWPAAFAAAHGRAGCDRGAGRYASPADAPEQSTRSPEPPAQPPTEPQTSRTPTHTQRLTSPRHHPRRRQRIPPVKGTIQAPPLHTQHLPQTPQPPQPQPHPPAPQASPTAANTGAGRRALPPASAATPRPPQTPTAP